MPKNKSIKDATEEELKDFKLDYIRFRCTTAEKEMAKDLAKKEHMDLSTYILRLIYLDKEAKDNK